MKMNKISDKYYKTDQLINNINKNNYVHMTLRKTNDKAKKYYK